MIVKTAQDGGYRACHDMRDRQEHAQASGPLSELEDVTRDIRPMLRTDDTSRGRYQLRLVVLALALFPLGGRCNTWAIGVKKQIERYVVIKT